MRPRPLAITQVADDVHLVAGTNVNWAVVTEGAAVTLVDAGYPGDAAAVLASVEALGRRPEDVVAVLLTHAHLDHLGGVPTVVRRSGARVVTGREEARHARREYLEQAGPRDLLRHTTTAAGRRWVYRTLRAVGRQVNLRLEDVEVAPDDAAIEAPGSLVAVPTPGHTPGHTAFLMPSTGVLFTGDALVTGHPLCRHDGPQLLPSLFNHDEAAMRASLVELRSVPAGVVAPGHGRPLEAPLPDVVDAALAQHR